MTCSVTIPKIDKYSMIVIQHIYFISMQLHFNVLSDVLCVPATMRLINFRVVYDSGASG